MRVQPTLDPVAADVDRAAAAVELDHIRRVFGRVVAVEDLSLRVDHGEFFAMVGPSGSGKTTALRMIAGFETPSSGRIQLGGRDVTDDPAYRRNVSTVFQDYALFPHMSVAQNIDYPLRVIGVGSAERRQRVGEALDLVRLGDRGGRKPHELSGGQRQRVALARALVGRPHVLLLDEPLGALDHQLREQMQVELRTIQREVGITFLFVTHDQNEALTLCDRVAVFSDGRIEQLGSAAEVYEHPANEFVARFMGVANLLRGEEAAAVIGRAGTYALRAEKIRMVGADERLPAGWRSVSCVVSEVVYSGATTRVLATAPDGTLLTALSLNPSDDLTERPARGSEVRFAWHESAVRPLTPDPISTKDLS